MRDSAFEHRFPARGEAVVEPNIRRKERAFNSLAEIFDGAKLDFHFPGLRDRRIRPVERAIGLGGAAGPAKRGSYSERCGRFPSLHDTGRNTQIAAGSLDCARTATN